MMASAIAIDTFFSTCGACADAGAATSMDAASTARETRCIDILPFVFAYQAGNRRNRVLIRKGWQYCCRTGEASAPLSPGPVGGDEGGLGLPSFPLSPPKYPASGPQLAAPFVIDAAPAMEKPMSVYYIAEH